jgi:hypothetical protein
MVRLAATAICIPSIFNDVVVQSSHGKAFIIRETDKHNEFSENATTWINKTFAHTQLTV